MTIPSIMDNFQDAKAAKKALRKARKEAKKIAKPNKHKHKKNKKHKKDKIHNNSEDFFRQNAQKSQQQDEQNNIINIGDVVWVKESDSLWWPAKVIWADNNLDPGDDRIKSTDLHVELYNRDQEKLRTSSSNLIKPFTEFVSSYDQLPVCIMTL